MGDLFDVFDEHEQERMRQFCWDAVFAQQLCAKSKKDLIGLPAHPAELAVKPQRYLLQKSGVCLEVFIIAIVGLYIKIFKIT